MPTKNTLQNIISFRGIGAHSGSEVAIELHPSTSGRVEFWHMESGVKIPALWNYVCSTTLCTTIASEGATIATIEHLMSAFFGLKIDSVLVKVWGGELPILDGSSGVFAAEILRIGIKPIDSSRKIMRIAKEITVEDGGRQVKLSPHQGQKFSFSCKFHGKTKLADQEFSIELADQDYISQVSQARTFGFLSDFEQLQQRGLAKGSNLENAVGIDENGVINPEGLRFYNECARHKTLDAMGDLYLAGMPIEGHFHGQSSGHSMNYQLLQALMTSDAYEII